MKITDATVAGDTAAAPCAEAGALRTRPAGERASRLAYCPPINSMELYAVFYGVDRNYYEFL